MPTLRVLRNNVMFQFLDSSGGAKGRFSTQTQSGILIAPSVSNQKGNRWGRVVAAGPDAAVKPGDYILVEALMWMEGTQFEGERMWKTDDSKILVVTDDVDACEPQI